MVIWTCRVSSDGPENFGLCLGQWVKLENYGLALRFGISSKRQLQPLLYITSLPGEKNYYPDGVVDWWTVWKHKLPLTVKLQRGNQSLQTNRPFSLKSGQSFQIDDKKFTIEFFEFEKTSEAMDENPSYSRIKRRQARRRSPGLVSPMRRINPKSDR